MGSGDVQKVISLCFRTVRKLCLRSGMFELWVLCRLLVHHVRVLGRYGVFQLGGRMGAIREPWHRGEFRRGTVPAARDAAYTFTKAILIFAIYAG